MFDRTQDEAPAQGLWSVLQKAQALWAHHDWYRGADLGFRWRSGKAQGEICIRIHLRHKRPRDLVLASALLPAELDGIAIDVLEASYCPAPLSRQETPSSAANPYTLGGLACCRNAPWAGHGQITLLACCKTSGKPGLLSSWQALAGAKAEVNDPISRPGKDATGIDPQVHTTGLYWLDLDDEPQALAWAAFRMRPSRPFDQSSSTTSSLPSLSSIAAMSTARPLPCSEIRAPLRLFRVRHA